MGNGNGFGPKVFSELHRQNIGIRTLARKMDPKQPERARRNLNRWIHEGVKPSPANRVAVAVALGIDEGEFADEDDEEDAETLMAFGQLMRALDLRVDEKVKAALEKERV